MSNSDWYLHKNSLPFSVKSDHLKTFEVMSLIRKNIDFSCNNVVLDLQIEKLSTMQLAFYRYFNSFDYEYFLYTINVWIYIFLLFGYNAADESLPLKTRVQHIEICNINVRDIFCIFIQLNLQLLKRVHLKRILQCWHKLIL